MVPYRHVLPIGEKGILWITEHFSDVPGMILTGIKVGVVAYIHRHVHGDRRDWNETQCAEVGVVSELD